MTTLKTAVYIADYKFSSKSSLRVNILAWQIWYRQDIIPLTHYFPVNLFEECCGWQ